MKSDCRGYLYGKLTAITYAIVSSASNMRLILNVSTKTAHRPADSADGRSADCGALRHVSDDRIEEMAEEQLEDELVVEIDRCGRCFEDCGGY